jgi:uncharacterized protein YjbI with pentapeptide repeats
VANREHLKLLGQGMEVWDEWRLKNSQIQADLSGADLSEADLGMMDFSGADLRGAVLRDANLSDAGLSGVNLRKADLSGADFRGAVLQGADLSETNFGDADLREADFREAYLFKADLREADLRGAVLQGADLDDADLRGANISDADLSGTDLRGANLCGADLTGANLMYANLIETNCENANFTNCEIYGISAWNLKLQGAVQSDLIITQDDEPIITVDNLEVAQFIYLLLHNEKIREVIDTISRKVVLILGRFTPERKEILDTIRNELRNHDYLPVMFDFEKPTNRDLTETVRTLAHLARFIIADITEPRSIPQELQAIVPHLAVPVQPLLLEGSTGEYAMFQDLKKKYHWVLPIHQYKDINYLLDSLGEKVIAPAEAKAQELEKR